VLVSAALGAGAWFLFKSIPAPVAAPQPPVTVAALSPAQQTNEELLRERTKASVDKFARQVVTHLLDTGFDTYESSMRNLMNEELAPTAVAHLQRAGLLPRTVQEQNAHAKSLADKQQVCAISIDESVVGTKNAAALIPCELSGMNLSYSRKHRASASLKPFAMNLQIATENNQLKVHSIDVNPPAHSSPAKHSHSR
jgi:hypothetical protein